MSAYLVEVGYLRDKESFDKESEYDYYNACYDNKTGYYDNGQYYREKSDWRNAVQSGMHDLIDNRRDNDKMGIWCIKSLAGNENVESKDSDYMDAYCIISVTDIFSSWGDVSELEVTNEDYLPQNVMFSAKLDKDGNITYNFIEGQQVDRIITMNAEHYFNGYLMSNVYDEIQGLQVDGSIAKDMYVGPDSTPVKMLFTKDEYEKIDIDILYKNRNIAFIQDVSVEDLERTADEVLSGSKDYFKDCTKSLFDLLEEEKEIER